MSKGGPRRIQADALHRFIEQLAVFGHIDGFFSRTNHFYTVLSQHTMARKIQRAVECGLATHGRQQGIGLFFFDNTRNSPPLDGLDIGRIGHCRVGHDSGGIGVHQNDPVTLLAQSLTGLGT